MGISYVLVKKNKPEIYDLDDGAWHGLDPSPSYSLFTMQERGWTVPKLAALINTVLYMRDAANLAQDILDWAGDDEVVLIDNKQSYTDITRRKFKFSSAKHEIVRDRWAIYREEPANA